MDRDKSEVENLNKELTAEDLDQVNGGAMCAFSCDPHSCTDPDGYTCTDVFKCSGGFSAELQ